MANGTPQVEDGYTRIADELFDAILCFGFSKIELHIVLTVLRWTYGFQRKNWNTTYGKIASKCGLDRANIRKSALRLNTRKILEISEVKTTSRASVSIGINKHYGCWKSEVKTTSVPKVRLKQPRTEVKTTSPSMKDNLKTNTPCSPPLPDCIDSDIWGQTLAHRREHGWSVKPGWQKQNLTALAEWHDEGIDTSALLREYMRTGHQGIFKSHGKKQNGSHQQKLTGNAAGYAVAEEWLRQQRAQRGDASEHVGEQEGEPHG